MSNKKNCPPCTPRAYQITIEGKIDVSWSDWFSNLQIVAQKEANGMVLTTLRGVLTDQPALRGLLNRLWDLNLVLHSVYLVDPATLSIKE